MLFTESSSVSDDVPCVELIPSICSEDDQTIGVTLNEDRCLAQKSKLVFLGTIWLLDVISHNLVQLCFLMTPGTGSSGGTPHPTHTICCILRMYIARRR